MNSFSTSLVINHMRKATLGSIASRNCQPFVREPGGAWHCFAHNGDVKGIAADRRFRAGGLRPVGETDSEPAFCALMDMLRPLWSSVRVPPTGERRQVVAPQGRIVEEKMGMT